MDELDHKEARETAENFIAQKANVQRFQGRNNLSRCYLGRESELQGIRYSLLCFTPDDDPDISTRDLAELARKEHDELVDALDRVRVLEAASDFDTRENLKAQEAHRVAVAERDSAREELAALKDALRLEFPDAAEALELDDE